MVAEFWLMKNYVWTLRHTCMDEQTEVKFVAPKASSAGVKMCSKKRTRLGNVVVLNQIIFSKSNIVFHSKRMMFTTQSLQYLVYG